MNDINCPYCNGEIENCHDDGFGYEEDELHEQQCHHCDKYFVFMTAIIFDYTAYKADCLNGSDHKLEPVTHNPKVYPDWKRCSDCGYEEKGKVDKTALII